MLATRNCPTAITCYAYRGMGRFADAIRAHMDAEGISHAELARRLGHKSNGLVTRVLTQGKPLPLDDLDRWLDVLRLDDDLRERLWKQAYEDYAPAHVLKLVHRLEFVQERLEQEREHHEELRQVVREVLGSKAEFPPSEPQTPESDSHIES